MGNFLCRTCDSNIVDTNPTPNQSKTRASEFVKERDSKVPLLVFPEVESPNANPLYANLFHKPGDEITAKNGEKRNVATFSRSIPDGCEETSFDNKSPNENDMIVEDLCIVPLEDQNILKVSSKESWQVEGKSSRVSISSYEIKASARALVENVIASAMVMQAEANNFHPIAAD